MRTIDESEPNYATVSAWVNEGTNVYRTKNGYVHDRIELKRVDGSTEEDVLYSRARQLANYLNADLEESDEKE